MRSLRSILITGLLFAMTVSVFAQSPADAVSTLDRLRYGVDLYGQGLYTEALAELHKVEAETRSRAQKAESLYWIGITELSLGLYEAALTSLNTLYVFDPENVRSAELPYHKGRILYHLGRYNESIVQFGKYIDSLPVDENGAMDSSATYWKAQALYWVGECLFSMGQLDIARVIFQQIVDEYPDSYKYEASFYRIALISQKKVENDLLELLKWTHEESLKTIEEYRRREHTYEQALMEYQKRISDMQTESRHIEDRE